jgi:hypothetical protein
VDAAAQQFSQKIYRRRFLLPRDLPSALYLFLAKAV